MFSQLSKRSDFSKQIDFSRSEYQKYLALFISKPELYSDIPSKPLPHRQSLFFNKFIKFIKLYTNLDPKSDEFMYFTSRDVVKSCACNFSGSDHNGNADRKKFLASQKETMAENEYLINKYKINLKPEEDSRVFIGHVKIWENPSPELLVKSGWEWVANEQYNDTSFNAPFPDNVDKTLVPLEIRTKTIQKWSAHKKAQAVACAVKSSVSDDEEELKTPEKEIKIEVNEEQNKIMNALSSMNFDDEDW